MMSKRVGFFLAAYAAAVAASTVAQSILSSTRDATLPQQTHFNKKIGPGFVCLDSFSTNAKSITKRADYFAFTRRGSHSPIIYDVATKNINNRIMRENGKIFMASHGEMPLAATSTARYLIYWRGEHKEEYSQSFRQWEFLSALSASIADNSNCGLDASSVFRHLVDGTTFTNTFSFNPYRNNRTELPASVPLYQVDMYNEALQYVSFSSDMLNGPLTNRDVSPVMIATATRRCSLIHFSYLAVAEAMEYSELVRRASKSDAFEDVITNESQESHKTWRVRRHEYNFVNGENNPRFGKGTTRSVKKERAALIELEPFLIKFEGKVDLKNPYCNIYLLEGICDNNETETKENNDNPLQEPELLKILARKLASGPKVSVMAPNTRICVTNTPLCPIAAYLLCNIALIQEGDTILDPFSGSAATLLAASLIAPTVKVVGIEIASDDFLSRAKIREDFSTRKLPQPVGLLIGDAMNFTVREEAQKLIGGDGFDAIVCDPPYGIREAMSGSESGHDDGSAALFDLIDTIGHDRRLGRPLLKKFGKLVSFFPCRQGFDIEELMPSTERLALAGLQLEDKREQRLNSALSRWVLSFISI